MKYRIGELSLGEVLDNAVNVVKDNFGLLFGIILVFQLPVMIIFGLVTAVMIGGIDAAPPQNPDQAMAAMMPLLVTLGIFLLVMILAVPITQAAIIHAVSKKYMGESCTIGECYGTAFSRLGPLILTSIMVGIVIVIGFVLCVVPGIIFGLWFGLASQVVVIEGLSGGAAMKRSKELVTGNMGTFFALGFILGLINYLAGLGINLVPNIYVQQIVNAVLGTILTLFGSAASVIFYFSCRSKLENFDVSVLARSFGLEKMGQNFAQQGGMPPQGMPPQGMPPQGMPPQGMPPQNPQQGYPPQNPQQGYPPQNPPQGGNDQNPYS